MHMVALNETKHLRVGSWKSNLLYRYVGLHYWSECAYCQWN